MSVSLAGSFFFFFKQKTAYEMRISDWSSDVCSAELCDEGVLGAAQHGERRDAAEVVGVLGAAVRTVEDRRRGGPLRRPVAESGLRIDRVHGPSVYGTSPPASSAGRSGRRRAQAARSAHGPSAEMGV